MSGWVDVELVDGPRHGYTMQLPAGRVPEVLEVAGFVPLGPAGFTDPDRALPADVRPPPRLQYRRTSHVRVVEDPPGTPPVERLLYQFEA